ncbi:MAG: ATP-binding cassette domain-containing protein [Bacteroidetes bacterium]|nr:MAG: ATP-binding cassette domain-containing protein [Bacteroidota bacterium]
MIDQLSWNSLSYTYDGRTTLSFPDGVVHRGEMIAVIGNSGSGKSTWMQLLSGILAIQEGNILYGTTSLLRKSETQRDKLRSQHVGLIFQKNHFLNDLSVQDNLMLPSYAVRQKPDVSFITEHAEKLSVSHLLQSKPSECSVGELQRLSILRTLSTKPSFILADEPTSALDDVNASAILDIFETISKEQNIGILIVTHDQRVKSRVSNTIQIGK